MSIIIDGMDQHCTAIPQLHPAPKTLSHTDQLNTHITGRYCTWQRSTHLHWRPKNTLMTATSPSTSSSAFSSATPDSLPTEPLYLPIRQHSKGEQESTRLCLSLSLSGAQYLQKRWTNPFKIITTYSLNPRPIAISFFKLPGEHLGNNGNTLIMSLKL